MEINMRMEGVMGVQVLQRNRDPRHFQIRWHNQTNFNDGLVQICRSQYQRDKGLPGVDYSTVSQGWTRLRKKKKKTKESFLF